MWDQFVSDVGDRLFTLRARAERVRWRDMAQAINPVAALARRRGRPAGRSDPDAARRWLYRGTVLTLLAVVAGGGYRATRGALASDTPPPARAVSRAQVFFYDLGAGQLYHAAADARPPFAAPSGDGADGLPQGVRAHVFSCGSCADPAQRVIGYLETYPWLEAAPAAPVGAKPQPGLVHQEGRLVAVPAREPRWVSAHTPEGVGIIRAAREQCGSATKTAYCLP